MEKPYALLADMATVNDTGVLTTPKILKPASEVKFLEIRVNTVQDAQEALRHCVEIDGIVRNKNMAGVEFLIANECYDSVVGILAGAFPRKVYYSRIAPKPDNVLWTPMAVVVPSLPTVTMSIQQAPIPTNQTNTVVAALENPPTQPKRSRNEARA